MFGYEVVSFMTSLDIVKCVQYKLHMMDVPINQKSYMVRHNMSVFNGAYVPDCKISKKHMGIWYHAVKYSSAAGICGVGFVKFR